MTPKPAGWVFMKISLPPGMARDLDDCLKLRGLKYWRAALFRMFAQEFIDMTKEELATTGQVETWGRPDEFDARKAE